MLASTSPTFLAASLNNTLSPIPISSRGSSFRCTGIPARNDTTESERNGCLVSLPCEDIIRSSRPRLRVGMRSSSSWSWSTKVFTEQIKGEPAGHTSSITPCQPRAVKTLRCRPYPPSNSSDPSPLMRTFARLVYGLCSEVRVSRTRPIPREAKYSAKARLCHRA